MIPNNYSWVKMPKFTEICNLLFLTQEFCRLSSTPLINAVSLFPKKRLAINKYSEIIIFFVTFSENKISKIAGLKIDINNLSIEETLIFLFVDLVRTLFISSEFLLTPSKICLANFRLEFSIS